MGPSWNTDKLEDFIDEKTTIFPTWKQAVLICIYTITLVSIFIMGGSEIPTITLVIAFVFGTQWGSLQAQKGFAEEMEDRCTDGTPQDAR